MTVAYTHYLQKFADTDCNLYTDLNNSVDNAEVFKKVLLSRKNTASTQQKQAPSREKSLGKLSRRSKNVSQEELEKSQSIDNNKTLEFHRGKSQDQSKTALSNEPNATSIVLDKKGSFKDSQSNFYSTTGQPGRPTSVSSRRNFDQSDVLNPIKERAKSIDKSKVEVPPLIPNNGTAKVKPNIMEDQNIISLKGKIDRYITRQKTVKKEVPFKHDKNFIGSRKLQLKQLNFNVRNGLLPSTKINSSFGL